MTDRAPCIAIATWGVWKRGWTFERTLKKFPSRDKAKVIRAPLIATPFKEAVSAMTMATDTRAAAPDPRKEERTASDIGDGEEATVVGARAYCTAAFTSM